MAELRGRRSRPAVKAVKQRTRSAISIRNQIEHRERRHAIRVNVVGQERKIEKDRNNRVRGVRHFNQGRGRFRDNVLRGKGDRHPRNDRFDRRSDQRDRRNRFGGKSWSRRKDNEHRPTEWNTNMHRDGDAQLTRTTSGTISLERNDVRRNRQVIPEGNAPMMRRKLALACITERCCIFAANVCTGMEINKCMQTKRGAIHPQVNCS